MNTKIHYLRDVRTERTDKVGTKHRGTPVAVVATEVNRQECTIRYAVAMCHPSETFNKEFARSIALERLNGQDKREKPKSVRRGKTSKSCSGARTIVHQEMAGGSLTSPGFKRVPVPESGHDITQIVMRHIFASVDLPDKLRDLACDWLDYDAAKKANREAEADRLPTIPVPAVVEEKPVRRMDDKPQDMRIVALGTTDRRHRDVIPPPPMTFTKSHPTVAYGAGTKSEPGWMHGRTVIEIRAIGRAHAECDEGVTLQQVAEWYDQAKARGFDGSIPLPGKNLAEAAMVEDNVRRGMARAAAEVVARAHTMQTILGGSSRAEKA